MKAFNFFDIYVSTEKNANQQIFLEAKLIRGTSDDIKSPPNLQLNAVLLVAPFCFVIVWQTIMFSMKVFHKFSQKDKSKNYNLKKVHCRSCRFFINNHYLKCAVHPDLALTKQSLNCHDYHQEKRHSL